MKTTSKKAAANFNIKALFRIICPVKLQNCNERANSLSSPAAVDIKP